MRKYAQIICALLLSSTTTFAQLKFSGYGEVYYNHDFSSTDGLRDAWFYNHNLHNAIAPNVFILQSNYTKRGVYAQLDLMFGSYAGAIMQNEPEWAQHIYQAYVGWEVKKNFNVEMGIFESGIGLESAKGAENPTLTRSIFAENTPYFLSGIRARWNDPTDVFMVEVAVVNGWETVIRHAPESSPGVMGRFRLGSNKVQLHYNFLYTNDFGGIPTPRAQMLNGFYFKHTLNKWQWYIGSDFLSIEGDAVYLPYLILRREINEKWAIAARGEYVRDLSSYENTIMAKDPLPTFGIGRQLDIWGTSLNVDYSPRDKFLLRVEARWLEGNYDELLPAYGPTFLLWDSNKVAYQNISLTLAAIFSF